MTQISDLIRKKTEWKNGKVEILRITLYVDSLTRIKNHHWQHINSSKHRILINSA